MRWVDVPAHRVLEVTEEELRKDFTIYDESGSPSHSHYTPPYRVVRDKDGKVFRPSRFCPYDQSKNIAYLEEL